MPHSKPLAGSEPSPGSSDRTPESVDNDAKSGGTEPNSSSTLPTSGTPSSLSDASPQVALATVPSLDLDSGSIGGCPQYESKVAPSGTGGSISPGVDHSSGCVHSNGPTVLSNKEPNDNEDSLDKITSYPSLPELLQNGGFQSVPSKVKGEASGPPMSAMTEYLAYRQKKDASAPKEETPLIGTPKKVPTVAGKTWPPFKAIPLGTKKPQAPNKRNPSPKPPSTCKEATKMGQGTAPVTGSSAAPVPKDAKLTLDKDGGSKGKSNPTAGIFSFGGVRTTDTAQGTKRSDSDKSDDAK